MAFLPTVSLPPPCFTTALSSSTSPLRRPPPRMTSSPNPYYDPNYNSTPSTSDPPTHTSPPSPPLEASVRPVPSSDLKQDLLTLVAGSNRGFITSPFSSPQIDSLITSLEQISPSEYPADDPLLFGKWRLVYTDALDVLSLSLIAPIAQISAIYQNVFEVAPIDNKQYEYDIENVVMLEPFFAPVSNAFVGRTVAELKVAAEGKRVSERRIDITFVETGFRPKSLVGIDLDSRFLKGSLRIFSPVGFIDTTYLDADIRIARSSQNTGTSEGNVFVLVREQ